VSECIKNVWFWCKKNAKCTILSQSPPPMGRGTPSPTTHPPRRLRRLDLNPPFWNSAYATDLAWKLVLKKQSRWTARWWKLHDPTVIRFESIPACDGRTERRTDRQIMPRMPMSRSSTADERDKHVVNEDIVLTCIHNVNAWLMS